MQSKVQDRYVQEDRKSLRHKLVGLVGWNAMFFAQLLQLSSRKRSVNIYLIPHGGYTLGGKTPDSDSWKLKSQPLGSLRRFSCCEKTVRTHGNQNEQNSCKLLQWKNCPMPTTYVLNQIFRGSGPEVVRCRSPQGYLPYKCRPRVEHDDIDDNMAIVAQITRTLFTRRIFKLQRRFLFFCAAAEKFLFAQIDHRIDTTWSSSDLQIGRLGIAPWLWPWESGKGITSARGVSTAEDIHCNGTCVKSTHIVDMALYTDKDITKTAMTLHEMESACFFCFFVQNLWKFYWKKPGSLSNMESAW